MNIIFSDFTNIELKDHWIKSEERKKKIQSSELTIIEFNHPLVDVQLVMKDNDLVKLKHMIEERLKSRGT